MATENKALHLLVVEDNPGDFVLLKKSLERSLIPVDKVHWVQKLVDVETIMNGHRIDIAFLDLSLGDSTGIDSFVKLNRSLQRIPIIVLSGLSDIRVAIEAISLGAQDYLVKGEFDEKLLAKSIRYGLERKKILEKLEESNERFEIVNKATLDVIWDWNFSTNALYLSSSVKEILGYIEQDVSMDWFFEHIYRDDVDQVRTSLNRVLESGKKHWSSEFRFRIEGGEYKYIYSRGYALFDEEGKSYRMIGAATDLTDKRKLEEELVNQQLSQQKLITETTIRAQEKERNELAKELHDNINQVLATVKMFLNIAREDELVREDLVNRSYNHVNYAIEEIRKLSKSLVAPSLGDMGILEALQDLVGEVNLTKGLKAELQYEDLRQENLDANIELMLYRIVQEQVNNILKYARADKVVITLHIDEHDVYLSICDNGVGFDPTQKAKGIGLKNITSRVEFHSGKMKLNTAPGMGCTLEINIPV